MHLQEYRAFFRDRRFVIFEVRAVCRADLDHPCAGKGHDVRDAEGAADLDEFPARDDGFFILRERREGQDHRRRVVVDDERRLRLREAAEQPFHVVVAVAARALFE